MKVGQSSASIWSDWIASAWEISVLEDLTTTEATSSSGRARRFCEEGEGGTREEEGGVVKSL